MGQTKYADQVREHVRHQYIEPARRRGDSTVRIVAGEVQKAVRLVNAVQPAGESPLLRLWGIGKEVFQSLGGGEAFIRSEREQWGRRSPHGTLQTGRDHPTRFTWPAPRTPCLLY